MLGSHGAHIVLTMKERRMQRGECVEGGWECKLNFMSENTGKETHSDNVRGLRQHRGNQKDEANSRGHEKKRNFKECLCALELQ